MSTWTVAGVQMDCRLRDRAANLSAIRSKLAEAAGQGARLVVFPECILAGYGFGSRAEARQHAEPLPGPSTDAIAADCARLGVWAVYGLLESAGERLFNACALVGPTGYFASFHKIHWPCLGADRFTDPGDRPFAVHDLGGLKLGINICFDGGFPESSRIMTLQGADLVVLPTNWADNAYKMATLVPRVRAFENHIYYLAVNRVGTESGFHYIGHSSFTDHLGDYLAYANHDREAILYGTVDPAAARQKRVVHCAGEYEIDRVNWRRPDVYGPLVETPAVPFTGHHSG
jgi:predicted amidohydrolase